MSAKALVSLKVIILEDKVLFLSLKLKGSEAETKCVLLPYNQLTSALLCSETEAWLRRTMPSFSLYQSCVVNNIWMMCTYFTPAKSAGPLEVKSSLRLQLFALFLPSLVNQKKENCMNLSYFTVKLTTLYKQAPRPPKKKQNLWLPVSECTGKQAWSLSL